MESSVIEHITPKKNSFLASIVIPSLAAFSTYSCMYAFRKPFTAATFDGLEFLHIHYKVWLIISQLIGYTASKFYGIKFISESVSKNRAKLIVAFISLAWIALLFFALTPAPYNIPFMFLNGFPLGMVWGLVFSYLEGRRSTEFLGAVLCVSFIFSSGFVKSVGSILMLQYHVSEFWMPFFTGMIFMLPLLISVYLLQLTPDPTEEDIQFRMKRKSMTAQERKTFLLSFLPGIVLLIITYVLLSVIRDFRDNFAAEIWKENHILSPDIFTKTEIPVSVIILVMISFLVFVKNNKRALLINHIIVIAGFGMTLLSTYLFYTRIISPVYWMIFSGLGLYMGYVPFNCIFFDRLIAYVRISATVGFLIYLADSFGYLGSLGILLMKELASIQLPWTEFFIRIFSFSSIIGIICMLFSWIYFKNKKHQYE